MVLKKKLIASIAALSILASTSSCAPVFQNNSQTQDVKPAKKEVSLSLENRLFEVDGVKVLILEGTLYEKGYIRGKLLGKEIREAGKGVMDYAYKQVPGGKFLIPKILDWVYAQQEPFIPKPYKDELEGLSDGSGIPLKQLQRSVAIPTLYSNIDAKLIPFQRFIDKFKKLGISCSSFAAWGKATKDGQMYMIRNLDWAKETKIYNYPLVSVYKEEGFVNIGYVGLIGVLSGMNLEGISIGEIGAVTKDYTYKGTPMIYLLRKTLEEADDLEDVVRIFSEAKRDSGFNYVFGDGQAMGGISLETTAHHIAVFKDNDEKEKKVDYAIPIEDAVLRSDTAVDQEIRRTQICSGGYPHKPSGMAHEIRYVKAARLIQENYGNIDERVAMKIAKEIAPKSNIQSVIYSSSTGEFWLANASDGKRAVDNEYVHFSMKELFNH